MHLAHELRGTKIKVNSAHPGWVKTDMGTDAAPMDLVDGAKTEVELATTEVELAITEEERGTTAGELAAAVQVTAVETVEAEAGIASATQAPRVPGDLAG